MQNGTTFNGQYSILLFELFIDWSISFSIYSTCTTHAKYTHTSTPVWLRWHFHEKINSLCFLFHCVSFHWSEMKNKTRIENELLMICCVSPLSNTIVWKCRPISVNSTLLANLIKLHNHFKRNRTEKEKEKKWTTSTIVTLTQTLSEERREWWKRSYTSDDNDNSIE